MKSLKEIRKYFMLAISCLKSPKCLLILLAIILLIIIPVSLYFSVFNNGLSTDSRHWSDFSTFISLFVSIISMILIGYISYITADVTKKFNERQLRPHIFIVEAQALKTEYKLPRTFQLNNSSSVPANNVILRYCFINEKTNWTSWIICFSLGPEKRLEVGWVDHADTIQICYSNIENTKFYLYEFRNWTGHEKEIKKEEYDAYFHQALAKKIKNKNEEDIILTSNIAEEQLINFLQEKTKSKKDFLKDYLKPNPNEQGN